jgi:Tol biopolymer transport system component
MRRLIPVRARTVAGALALALLASGCAYARQVSRVAPDPTGTGVFDFAVSADGRWVVFQAPSDTSVPGARTEIYLRDMSLADAPSEVVSVTGAGIPADDFSNSPSISADGRYVAFASDSDEIVPDDDNGITDVFVRDRLTQTTERISVTSDGIQVDDGSYLPVITPSGRHVAFVSDSDDLALADANGAPDAYVHDRLTGAVELVSVSNTEQEAEDGVDDFYPLAISDDGNIVAFTTFSALGGTDENDTEDVYVRDRAAGSTRRVTPSRTGIPSGGGGEAPSLSADGRFVAFQSYAPDIDIKVDTNETYDVFVRDLVAGGVTRVNVLPNGSTPPIGASIRPSISADGTRVAFRSMVQLADDTNPQWDIFVRDIPRARTQLVSTGNFLSQQPIDAMFADISADGRYVAWTTDGAYDATDTNGLRDVYLRALDVPKISAVVPNTVKAGTTATFEIVGDDFRPDVLVTGIEDIVDVVRNSPTSISVTVTLGAAAPPGTYSLGVMNPGTGPGFLSGSAGSCADCLTVVP